MSRENMVHRLKNYYSFGKQSMMSNSDRIVTGESQEIRIEQQFSFDYQKDFDGFGMEIVNVEQKVFDGVLGIQEWIQIKKVKFERFINFMKESMMGMKLEVNKIRELHVNFMSDFFEQNLKKQFEEKLRKEGENSYKNVQQSLKYKLKNGKFERKKHLKNMSVGGERKGEEQFGEGDGGDMNEIRELRDEIESRVKEIQLLKQQLSQMKDLSDRKEKYLMGVMKVKELEWGRRVREMTGSYVDGCDLMNYGDRYFSSSMNKQKRVVTEGCESLSERLRNGMGKGFDERYGDLDVGVGKVNGRRNLGIGDVYKSCLSFEKYEKQDEARIVEREVKRRDRKKSTDFSFQRVSEKIKIFESSIKR